MKKIKIFIAILLMTIMLTSCDFDFSSLIDGGIGGDSFKKYLDKQEPLTSETLDAMFEQDLIPEDRFANFKIENTKVTYEESGIKNYFHVWQKSDKVYMNMIEDEDSVLETYFIDLGELEETYDDAKLELGLKSGMTVSEIYNHIIDEYGNELGLKDTILTEKSLDDMLDIFNYKYEDFKEVEKGKYEIKKDAILLKLIKLSIEEITLEDFKEMLFDNNIDFKVYVYFDGEHITDYEIIVEETELEETVKVKLTLLYDEEDFCGITVEVDSEEFSGVATIEYKNEELNISLLLNVDGEKIKFKLKMTKDSITSNLKIDDEEYYDAKLYYKVEKEGKENSLTLNGTLDIIDGIKITIDGGSNVAIPAKVLATEKEAISLLDQIL